jgi:hypothetical protein
VARALVKVEEASASPDPIGRQMPTLRGPPQVAEGSEQESASPSHLNRANTDARPELNAIDRIPWGDFAGRKRRNFLRLIGTNIGGFGLYSNSSSDKGPAIRELVNTNEADAIAMSELNLHWAHVPTKECIPEWTLGWWHPFRQSTAYFKAWATQSA